MRGGRNVKEVRDEYVYSSFLRRDEQKKINTTQQKKNKRKSKGRYFGQKRPLLRGGVE